MKNLRKTLVFVLVMMLCLAMFVACGDKGNTQPSGDGNQGGGQQQVGYFDYNLSEIFAKYADIEDYNFKAQYDVYVSDMDAPNYSYTFGFKDVLTMSIAYEYEGEDYLDYYVDGEAYYYDNGDGTYSKYLNGSEEYDYLTYDIDGERFYIDELSKLTFEHFDLESLEGKSGKFNQYAAKDPVQAGNTIWGEWVEDPDYDMYWTRVEIYLQDDDLYRIVATANCDYLNEDAEIETDQYKYDIVLSDFGMVDFDLADLTIEQEDGQTEQKTYTAEFTDENLSNTSGIEFASSRSADGFESSQPNRGVQFYKSNGAVTITTDNLTSVTSVSLVVSSNRANTVITVKVGDVDFTCNGNTSVSFKENNATYTFTSEASVDGALSITFTPSGSGSMYIKSVEVVCGGSTGGGTKPTPTETMPAQVFDAAKLDKSTLREKMYEWLRGNDWEDPLPLQSVGTFNYLVVPIEFSDYAINQTQLDKLNKAFNGTTTETGWQSVQSYYQTSSYGKLNMSFEVYDKFTAPNDSAYYENYSKSLTMDGQSFDQTGDALLLEQVMAWLEPRVDLTKYDYDKDGVLDGIWLIYSAPVVYGTEDASSSSADDSIYWAYVTTYYKADNVTTTYDKLDLGYYLFAGFDFMDEYTGNDNDPYYDTTGEYIDMTISGLKINASTYIHETGHMLGLDDYYDYDETKGSKSGLGGADMMDYTVGDQNAYSKTILGWVAPTVVTTTQTITIKDFATSGDCIMVLLDYDGSYFSEYLLIDLYSAKGLNAAHANQANSYLYYDFDTEKGAEYGVRIYHVSSDIKDPYSDDYFSFTTNNNTYSSVPLIELVQADGGVDYSDDEYGLCNADDLWQAGGKLSTVFPNYARNDNKKVNFDIEIVSVSATQATITITFTA